MKQLKNGENFITKISVIRTLLPLYLVNKKISWDVHKAQVGRNISISVRKSVETFYLLTKTQMDT